MDLQTKVLCEGIKLHMIPDDKFKTCVQGIYFTVPLRRETATGFAILPKLLTAANAVYEDRSILNMEAEKLFGTRLNFGVGKVGETQVLSFTADSIADAYADDSLFSKVQKLLQTILCEPKGENAFPETIFLREKEALREDIRSIVNDKRRYALMRCTEEMCKNEKYGIRADGNEEDLDKLTSEEVFKLYKNMLASAEVNIFVTGAFSMQEAENEIQKFANRIGARNAERTVTDRLLPEDVRYIEDNEPVKQGKLVIGYRADVDVLSDDYYSLLIYNGIFGGGTSSKLFNIVREKMSLCYYASSQLERAKSLLFVQSGIEFEKYNVALEAIRKQHAEICDGNISDAEFTGTVQGLVNALRSYEDSPASLQSYYVRQLATGNMVEIEDVIQKILLVKPEQIPEIARHIHMDTVYFLNGMGGEDK